MSGLVVILLNNKNILGQVYSSQMFTFTYVHSSSGLLCSQLEYLNYSAVWILNSPLIKWISHDLCVLCREANTLIQQFSTEQFSSGFSPPQCGSVCILSMPSPNPLHTQTHTHWPLATYGHSCTTDMEDSVTYFTLLPSSVHNGELQGSLHDTKSSVFNKKYIFYN